jgi:hypothetical protein
MAAARQPMMARHWMALVVTTLEASHRCALVPNHFNPQSISVMECARGFV